MKFGAIVCPGCKRARGILLTSKTTTCTHCGKKFKTKGLKIYYKTDSAKELAVAVGEINASLYRSLYRIEKE